MTQIAQLLKLTIGSDNRVYRLCNQVNDIDFESETWMGTSNGTIYINRTGALSYNLDNDSQTVGVEVISSDSVFISDISYGSALSEGELILIYYDGTLWQRCPANFKGLIGGVSIQNQIVKLTLDSDDLDKDRIRPVIWSDEVQKQNGGDRGFSHLPDIVRGIRRRFLEPIEDR